jgi:Flp pilus assembly protein TadD
MMRGLARHRRSRTRMPRRSRRLVPLVALFGALAVQSCAGRPAPRSASSAATAPARAQSPAELLAQGQKELAQSKYAAAEKTLSRVPDGPLRGEALLALAEVRRITGRYAEAQATAQAARAASPALGLRARVIEAQALSARGALAEAEAVLREVEADPAAREARLYLGEILLEQGRRSDAEGPLMTLIEDYNEDRIAEGDGPGLALVGRAAYLLRSPRDANDAFNAAERAAPGDVRTLLWRAELFLDKYDPGHAEEVLLELLAQAPEHPEANVWLAHVRLAQALDFDEAERLARAALAVNPRLTAAYFVLAGISLRDMELEAADQRIAQGLAHNPRDLPLLSLRATSRFLADDGAGFQREKQAVLSQNPGFSELYAILAEYADWEHRYDEIVALMQEAVRLDAEDAKSYAQLGLNLIRAGDDREGVTALRRAFSLDPFNVRVFNTLNLYEKAIPKDYVSVSYKNFTIRYHKDERAILERYVPRWLDRAFAKMVSAYGFTPQTPIGVELYAEREHFAIRTSGLPQTAIQGVCFGKTLASMSPMNEPFNLGMTLWHELSHVFHIQLSKSRVPRWFTEGLAEYETIAARPEWVREQDPDLYQALRSGRLPEVANMSRAFTRAEELSDVATAYYASSQILVMMQERYGPERMAQMLRLWAQGKRTPEVVKLALGKSPAELDGEFRDFATKLVARYDAQFVPLRRAPRLEVAERQAKASPKDATLQAQLARALLREGNAALAKRALARALELDPRHAEARFTSAELDADGGQDKRAAATLRTMVADGQDGYAVQMLLAKVLAAKSDPAGSRAALEAAARLDPSQSAPWFALAEIAEKSADIDGELRALKRLAELEQHEPKVYERLLRRLVTGKMYDEALKYAEAALYADVKGLYTHLFVAEALAETGDAKGARFELESAVLCPGEPGERAEAHARLAELLRKMGDARGAKQHAETARSLDPHNARVKALP